MTALTSALEKDLLMLERVDSVTAAVVALLVGLEYGAASRSAGICPFRPDPLYGRRRGAGLYPRSAGRLSPHSS